MERALDPHLLGLAVGEPRQLPTSSELGQKLADAELELLLNQHGPRDSLAASAWHLFGVAASRNSSQVFGSDRVQSCYRVAAHLFDTLLRSDPSDASESSWLIPAQLAYHLGDLAPNAIAVFRRSRMRSSSIPFSTNAPDRTAMACASALLALDTRRTFELSGILRDEFVSLKESWDVSSLYDTFLGPTVGVIAATRHIAVFLQYGRVAALERGQSELQRVLADIDAPSSLTSRWLSHSLLLAAKKFSAQSIWRALPDSVPSIVKRVFAASSPQVTVMWPPQLALFTPTDSATTGPLSDESRRQFISTPTSGGKSLLAQLIVADHVARHTSGVCYVAPTRTLCREIREALDRRVRLLRKTVAVETSGVELGFLEDVSPDVEVMTPERFSALLRDDASGVLARFGLFVFDEIHNVGNDRRGWTLESALSFLHQATSTTPHRIVLISAAVGNQAHFVRWMSADGLTVQHSHSEWRGPRRILALWTTWRDQSSAEYEPRRGQRMARQRFALRGELHARVSHDGSIKRLTTNESIGTLSYKLDRQGRRVGKPESTAGYRMLVPLVSHLGASGPVLVVEATRAATLRTAAAIAAHSASSHNASVDLTDLVRLRLGDQHPLTRLVSRGVAYHHGSLPAEVRLAIEDAVVTGEIRYLVATTTMTEGVNLPVRSVVIASQGSYGPEGRVEYITGSTLLNAIGRAGRATRETEGIVVLARQARFTPADLDRLTPGPEETSVFSWLAAEDALAELAVFEAAVHNAEDNVIAAAGDHVSSFLSYVWFVLSRLDAVNQARTIDAVRKSLEHTLAWRQLPPDVTGRWLNAAMVCADQFDGTPRPTRQRWARADRALESSRVLQAIADEIISEIGTANPPSSLHEVVDLLLRGNRLERLLSLREAPSRRVYNRRGGRRTDITPDLRELLRSWIAGLELPQLADQHFAGVREIEYRYEQLGDFLNDYLEVFLPGVASTLIGWVNERLATADAESDEVRALPTRVPAFVRWGVDSADALTLMVRGLSSRRLALAIAARRTTEDPPIRAWLGAMSTSELRERFQTSAAELRRLILITRGERGGLAADLLAGQEITIGLRTTLATLEDQSAILRVVADNAAHPIAVFAGSALIGHLPSASHSDIESLLIQGTPLRVRASVSDGVATIRVQAAEVQAELTPL